MLLTIFSQLVQQIMPLFISQRSLYEVRERPSKTYSWQAFMMSQIIAEWPWAIFCATLLFVCWYYPIGLYRNAEPNAFSAVYAVHERGALMWLMIVVFLLFASSFSHMIIAGMADAETGGNIANVLFSLSLLFCGVLRGPTALPGFWIFMYYVSPFTYLVEGFLTTGVANAPVTCAANEYLIFTPPAGMSCGVYMADYIKSAGGYLENAAATDNCSFCSIADTNTFLAAISQSPAHMWRDFGIMWAYIIFNICAALLLYWLARVPKGNQNSVKETSEGEAPKAIESEIEKVVTSGE